MLLSPEQQNIPQFSRWDLPDQSRRTLSWERRRARNLPMVVPWFSDGHCILSQLLPGETTASAPYSGYFRGPSELASLHGQLEMKE